MKLFSAILIIMLHALFFGCSDSAGKTETLLIKKNFTLRENPAYPPQDLPRMFHYPRAKIIRSAIFNNNEFVEPAEGAVIFETDNNLSQIEEYYTSRINRNRWNIIQSHRSDNELLLMAESPGSDLNKLVTIIARGSNAVEIKVYFKRSDG